MDGLMLHLQGYRATSRERHFLEQIKAPIFLEVILVIEIMHEPHSHVEEKVNSIILRDDLF